MDKAVAEATEQRKEEHGEFITFQTQNSAAPQLIPGTSIVAMQTQLYAQLNEYTTDDASAAPPPPPATWDAYQKKDGKSNGVIALMDMLLKELQDGITEAENE